MVSFRHEPGPAPQQPAQRYNVDCGAIHDMDPVEVGRALVLRKKVEVESDESLHYLTADCSAFLEEFVEYMQTSDVVKDFLAWSEDTYSPDEFFWATLVRIPGVPGEVPRSEPDITDLMSKTRLVKWSYLEESLYPPCTGQHRRSVCIYGVGELHWLLNYGHWFANKFDPAVDLVIIQCLEENLQKKQTFLQSLVSSVC
uniref:Uncharacterized protein n=1 Tax=Knipowitschia caucasica TaxID=637954 RepID=A0AAV2IW04_KNICA